MIGAYGTGMTNAGDGIYITGLATYGAVNRSGVASNVVVAVDPLTGSVTSDVTGATVHTASARPVIGSTRSTRAVRSRTTTR
jgi:hypothetical protein